MLWACIMRAALLPTGADPFHIAYWLRHYKTWADSVDELHVAVCGPIPRQVIEYIGRIIGELPNATMHYLSHRTDHGKVLEFLLEQVSSDTVLFMEDDAFIRKPEVIDEAFSRIESGEVDVVGSPRNGYATQALISIATNRFGDEPEGLAFWPTFLFARTKNLLATDGRFGGTNWMPGDDFLGWRLGDFANADTFIWASYQLRAQGLKVELRDGHRLSERPMDHGVPWFHVGSLSQGHGNMWQNPLLTPEWYIHEREMCVRLPGYELPRRVAWWQRMWEKWDGCLEAYHTEYGEGLRKFIYDFMVDERTVEGLWREYAPLVTWPE